MKKSFLFISIIFMFFIASPSICQSNELKDHFKELFLERKYNEAISYLESFMKTWDAKYESEWIETGILDDLAFFCEEMGYYDKAEELLLHKLKSERKHSDFIYTYNRLAKFYIGKNRYTEAETYFLKALKLCEEKIGKDNPVFAKELYRYANYYEIMGYYSEAEELMLQALEIREKNLWRNYPLIAESLNNLAEYYFRRKRYTEAELHFVKALKISEKVLEEIQLDFAGSFNNLTGHYSLEEEQLYLKALKDIKEIIPSATYELIQHIKTAEASYKIMMSYNTGLNFNALAKLYQVTGCYAEAKQFYIWRDRVLEGNYLKIAESLNNLAMFNFNTGRYAEAEPLFVRALEILENKIDPNIVKSLNNLGALYQITKRYAEAESLHLRAKNIQEHNYNDSIDSIKHLAGLYINTGRYKAAEPLFLEILKRNEKSGGDNSINIVKSLNNLAFIYKAIGNYEEAEPLYKRALKISEKELGDEHPDVANILNNLSENYLRASRYAEAEELQLRALKIREKKLGNDHQDVAKSLNILAEVYSDTGRYKESEQLHLRALNIFEKVSGKDHSDVAASLNNLAALYKETGRYSEAEPLYVRSLAILEKVFDKDHPDIAASLSNQAGLYRETGRYTMAEPLLLRAKEICEKNYGRENPYFATSINNLAKLYYLMGHYSEAETLFKSAVMLTEKTFGKEHPNTARCFNNLALVYASTGKHKLAHNNFKLGMKIRKKNIENIFSMLSERQKIEYISTINSELNYFLSHIAQYQSKDINSVRDGLDALLQWKGIVTESQIRYEELLSDTDDPKVSMDYKRLNEVKGDIVRLAFSGSENMKKEENIAKLARLENEKEYIEAGMSTMSTAYALENKIGQISSQNITKLLPKGSYLIEYTCPEFYNFKDKKWEGTHYIAFILSSDEGRALGLVDFGEADKINKLIEEYRIMLKGSADEEEKAGKNDISENIELKDLQIGVLKDNKKGQVAAGQNIYNEIFTPLKAYLEKEKKIFAGPESDLKTIPLKVHISSDMKYLVDEYQFNKNPDGKEIMCFVGEEELSDNEIVIITDPDYDLASDILAKINVKEKVTKVIPQYFGESEGLNSGKFSVMRIKREAINNNLEDKYDKEPKLYLGNQAKDYKRLNEIKGRIAGFIFSGSGKTNDKEQNEKLSILEKEKLEIEARVNTMSKAFALEKEIGQIDSKGIARMLPKGSYLIEYSYAEFYDYKNKKMEKAHYMAFVLSSNEWSPVGFVDFNKADKINKFIEEYRIMVKGFAADQEITSKKGVSGDRELRDIKIENSLFENQKGRDEMAMKLYNEIFAPLKDYMGDGNNIFISPDGNLNFIPFEVLISPDGKYLIDEYQFNYITAGRDLMRFTAENETSNNEIVIMADPDFDLGTDKKEMVLSKLEVGEKDNLQFSREMRDLNFGRLSGTKVEGEAISLIIKEKYGKEPKLYLGEHALEEVLMKNKNPKILHIASHGFFLTDEMMGMFTNSVSDNTRGLSVKEMRNLSIIEDKVAKERPSMGNPMLCSGVALAGANTSLRSGQDKGILVAEKISGLRLRGTELVVLSACDTGVGEVKKGEGVFGLKRAFILAGAKTLVMSLWKVPDEETKDLMIEFYKNMADGKGKAEALREAKLKIKEKNPNPFYWGGFVSIGDPN